MNGTGSTGPIALGASLRIALMKAVEWLGESDASEQDPFLDPVFRRMSLRERADLPSAKWPNQRKSLSDCVGKAEGNAGAKDKFCSGPAEGCQDVQLAKRCASAP